MSACRLCGGAALSPLRVPERHFGTGQAYDYEHCGGCGSLQITAIPADLSAAYPAGYYSLGAHWKTRLRGLLRRLAKRLRDAHELGQGSWLGAWLARRSRYPELASLRGLGLGPGDAILDVGCGDGFLLWSLANLGFRELTGVDPHLAGDSPEGELPRLFKRELAGMQGAFDLVMFHHSLEHLAQPAAALAAAAGLLKPGGRCLVRVPTPDSLAFERYREHWIQIDAPRHLHLPSRRALRSLGEAAGLRLARGWDDGNAFQFWASEQARQGVSLEEPASWSRQGRGRFSRAQMKAWEAEAQELNRQGRGDSVAFLFEKGA